MFAWIVAICEELPPRKRMKRLKRTSEILEEWAAGPVTLRWPKGGEVRKSAVAIFKDALPRFMG